LATDFYEFAIAQKILRGDSPEMMKNWWLEKVDREYFVKMYSDELRERYRNDYEKCKKLFENL
jgi:hypothetical protein